MKAILSLILALITMQALAHKPSDSYLQLDARSDSKQLSGRWDIALRDLNLLIPLDENRDAVITWGVATYAGQFGQRDIARTQSDGLAGRHTLSVPINPDPFAGH